MLPVPDLSAPAAPDLRPLTVRTRVERLLATFTQLTLMDVARALDSSPQTISTILTALVKDGRAERERISRPCVRQGQHAQVYGYTLTTPGPLTETRRAPRLTKRAQVSAALSINLQDPLEAACLHVTRKALRGPLRAALKGWSETELTEHLSLVLINAAHAVHAHTQRSGRVNLRLHHTHGRAPHFTFMRAGATLDVSLDTLMQRLLYVRPRGQDLQPDLLALLERYRLDPQARSAYRRALDTHPTLSTELTRYALYPALFLDFKAQSEYGSRRDLHRVTEEHLDRLCPRLTPSTVDFPAAAPLSA